MNKIKNGSRYLTGGLTLLLVALVAGCGEEGPRHILGFGDSVAVVLPSVTATVPFNNATGIPVNAPVTATFIEPMQPLTAADNFQLSCAAPCTSPTGTVSLDPTSTIATYTPGAALAPATLYTATITAAKSSVSGLAMASPYVWHFTTAARPAVTFTAPATAVPGTTGVAINSAIDASFTVDMDPASITAASFSLNCASPCVAPAGNVSYVAASRTAVFTPLASLASGTVYTATLSTGMTDQTGDALGGNQALLPAASAYVWTFTTGVAPATTRPTVTLTAPATSVPGPTTGVPANTAIAAVFSLDMNPATITPASYTLSCAAPCVAPSGSVAYSVSTKTAVFKPAATLAADTTYTATLTTAATDLAGNALAGNQAPLPAASNYVWSFTTAIVVSTTRPTVTLTAPATTTPGPTTGVADGSAIAATFSEAMAPATITTSSFTLACAAPCVAPVGNVSYVAGTNTAVFTPQTLLTASTTYTATITRAATDVVGNTLSGNQGAAQAASNYVWSFTTLATPPLVRPQITLTAPATTIPGPTTGVSSSIAIAAIFTENMDPATITGSSFTVTCAAPCVSPAGTVSYTASTRTAVFTPAAILPADSTYTATLATTVTDLAGNALAGNQAPLPAASAYVWTFTTALPVSHITVLSTQPANLATEVCPGATVNATFHVPSGLRMDPTSVSSATFTLAGPAPTFTPVTAAGVTLDTATGQIATFTPLANLTSGETYTATITGGSNGVEDLAIPANDMANNYSWTFTAGPATGNCLAPIALGAIAPFGTFGGSAGTTNMGTLTIVNGDIGTTAVSTLVTGFHDSTAGCIYTETPLNVGTVNGSIYTAAPPPTVACPTEGTAVTFAVATQARAAALSAYNALVATPGGPDPGAGNLANLVLAPGAYTAAAGSFMIVGGNLVLDAQGNANAVWVFQMANSLTVGGPGAAFPESVMLVNGAQAKNVYWQVGSAATINAGGGGTMVGTIISQAGVALSTAGNVTLVTLNGRAISLGASVTMVNTVINVPAP